MTFRLARAPSAALATLITLGCTGGSETGNPVEPSQMGLSVHTSDPGTVDFRTGTNGIFIEEVWLGVSDISLVRLDTPDEEESDVEIEGLVVVDLTDPSSSRLEFALDPAEYTGLRADLSQAELPLPVGAPAELEDSSVVITGLTPAGRRFTLVLQQEVELEATSPMTSFTISAPMSQFVLSFDVARWFGDLDLDELEVEPDDSIRIDALSNPEALEAFEANMLRALELGADRNGNGTLDTGEERLALGEVP